jgi:hypothetical protein
MHEREMMLCYAFFKGMGKREKKGKNIGKTMQKQLKRKQVVEPYKEEGLF